MTFPLICVSGLGFPNLAYSATMQASGGVLGEEEVGALEHIWAPRYGRGVPAGEVLLEFSRMHEHLLHGFNARRIPHAEVAVVTVRECLGHEIDRRYVPQTDVRIECTTPIKILNQI